MGTSTRNLPAAAIDWDSCARIAATHGRTFYLASRLLPRDRRRAILAAYAYCRTADDLVDRATGNVEEAIDAWERQLTTPTDPVAIAFAAAREQFAIPIDPVRELLNGVRMDMSISRYQSWADLTTYCYRVAGTVGLIVAPILGCQDRTALPYAATLGIAMQLTNILRDVGEDAALGRIYLPQDDLAAFGCDSESVLSGTTATGIPGPHGV